MTSDLNVAKEFLEYIGADTVKYFGNLFIIYYMLLGIVVFNTYRAVKDYKNKKDTDKTYTIFNKYDLVVTLIVMGVELVSMAAIGAIFIEYGIYTYMYQLIVIFILSAILSFVQYHFYIKINGLYSLI